MLTVDFWQNLCWSKGSGKIYVKGWKGKKKKRKKEKLQPRWTVKKAEHRGIDSFELCCWRRLLRVPWTARKSKQSILKEIHPGCSLEVLMLKLKVQYFGHLMRRADSFEKPWCWERLKAGGEENDREWDAWMASPIHEFQWTLGIGDGQGGLACCRTWGCKELDTTKWVKWTELNEIDLIDSYMIAHQETVEYNFFSSAYGTISRIDHILGHKSSLAKFKKIEIVSIIFFC